MFAPEILLAAIANGLALGAIYAMIALGLTLVYGVLHIINFAHGAFLSAAMFGVYLLWAGLRLDPYLSILVLGPLFFVLGYGLQRWVIGPAARESESNGLMVTLGLSIFIENTLLATFRSDTRTIDLSYALTSVDLGFALLSYPQLAGFAFALLTAFLLWLLLTHSDTGKAIRAIAKERTGAALVGIDVAHIYAITFGLGAAIVAIAACLLLPTFYVTPRIGNAFVLIAFTIVVLGGMGSIPGALVGALLIGIVESLSGLIFGESLGQIGAFVLFILVLLVRPTGLFGARA